MNIRNIDILMPVILRYEGGLAPAHLLVAPVHLLFPCSAFVQHLYLFDSKAVNYDWISLFMQRE